tara:strand:- start:181532 stop:182032 length:501 start_codon:yes stop_codon:yes gene_type:complete
MANEETEKVPDRREANRRQTERRQTEKTEAAKSRNGIWIILSFALTAIIIAWGFSLPFRKHERPLLIWDEADLHRDDDVVRKVRLTKAESDAYRAQAIQRDREFLRERRDRLRNRTVLPGKAHAQAVAEKRIASMKKKIHQLRDAPKGSLESEYRQELIEKLDAPQ